MIDQIETATRYAGYVEKQQADVERSSRADSTLIPADLDLNGIRALSFEARQVLTAQRPESIGAASRLPGITPATISLLLVHVKKHRRDDSFNRARIPSSAGHLSAATRAGLAGDDQLADVLRTGAARLAVPLSDAQVEHLVAYVRLIEKWNVTYNLTAVRDPLAMVTHHLLDCLAAAGALLARRGDRRGERVLDVGSGAGLPGVVIAIVAPEREVVCVDSVGKKAAFITQAAGSLGLKNAVALHARVEKLPTTASTSSPAERSRRSGVFVADTGHLLAEDGVWMAMKGKAPESELAELSGLTFHVEPLRVPGLDAERCVVWLSPT